MLSIRRSQTLIAAAAISLFLLTYLSWNDRSYTDYVSSHTTSAHIDEETIREIDERYCGGPCRFLLPVFIVEQESKAQMHFRQLAFTAGLVNRTIVLPNVGNSRLGACNEHEFGFYYSHEWLDNNRDHFKYITLKHFQDWLEERGAVGTKPTSQDVILQLEPTRQHFSDNQVNCWQSWLDMQNLPVRHLDLADRESSSGVEIENKIVSFLKGPSEDELRDNVAVGRNLEVLSVFYDRRFPFIQNPASQTALTYSNQLTNLARDMADSISPFLAIHWRTERIEPASNLEKCARTLVQKIQNTSPKSIPNIFLLTDYPHLLNTPLAATHNGTSGSFRPSQISESHHAAMRYLYEHAKVTLTTFADPKEVQGLPANWTLLHMPPLKTIDGQLVQGDKGVLGIVDKMMAMRGHWFLAGQPGVCGRSSSFTNRIVAEREYLLEEENAGFANIVDYFDLPEQSDATI